MAGYSLDIMSASWGPTDVTNQARDLYKAQAKPGNSVFTFTPSNGLFGDPMVGIVKVFVMVWRVALQPNSQVQGPFIVYSMAQTARVVEQSTLNLDYSKGLSPYTPQANPPNNLIVYSASYNQVDVTAKINSLNTTVPLNIPVNNGTFGTDPNPGHVKQFSVTYAYVREDGFLDYNMKTGLEGNTVVLPKGPAPRLTIHAASFGGAEVTQLVRNAVTFDQTFTTQANTWPPGQNTDPWFGVRKVFSIMYQFGTGPLEILVALERTGSQIIAPFQPARSPFFNPSAGEYAGRTNVLAIVWGAMQNHPAPVSSQLFTNVADNSPLVCTNGAFGFDGLPNVGKTAVVFYQYGLTGSIQCLAGRENNTVYLSPRNSDNGDPLSGRGLLRTTPQVNGFYLKPVTASGNYLAMTATSLSATATTRADAALFHYVSASGTDPQALQVTSSGTTKYVQLTSSGQATLVQIQAEASQFDYEILSRAASLAVVLNLSTSDFAATPVVMMVDDGSTNVSTMPFVAMDNPTCCYFGFEWSMTAQAQTLLATEAVELDGISPCTLAFITIIKDWTIDLLSVLGNFHYFQMQGTKVTAIFLKWWQSLNSGVSGRIAQLITSLIAAGSRFVSAVGDLIGNGVVLLQYLWDVGAFWQLIQAFLSDVGWWDVMVMTSSVILTIAETINPASMALKVIGLGVWVAGTVHDLIGGYDACAPGVTLSVQKNLLVLHRAVRSITTHDALQVLGPKNQVLAVHNLLEPHYRRVLGGDKLWPPPSETPEESAGEGNIKLLPLRNANVDSAVYLLKAPFEAKLKDASGQLEAITRG